MARFRQSDSRERLTCGLYVQLTPSQRRELADAVAAQGARLSDYVRDRLFRKPSEPVRPLSQPNGTAKAILDELRRIGNNLNQLTHHANAQELIAEPAQLHETIAQLKTAMARVISL
jgi:hypothetical protein